MSGEWSSKRSDPTETPVDETDLDDAGPFGTAPLDLVDFRGPRPSRDGRLVRPLERPELLAVAPRARASDP